MFNFKQASGALIGNSMQFYDFTIYAFLSPQISKYFFPTHNLFFSYLLTISVFASGYLARPLGALFFGFIGDRKGRSRALSSTIIISTIATFCIGLLPIYSVGNYFPSIALIFLRLIQGLAVSGEEGGAVVLLFERNEFKKTGLIGSLVLSSVLFGVVIGSVVCFITTYLTTYKIINEWAWRIPFLLSLPIGLVAIKLRFNLNDFEAFNKAEQRKLTFKMPTLELFSGYRSKILFGVCVVSIYSITTSTLIVNFPYLLGMMGIGHEYALALITFSVILTGFVSPFLGRFCDKYTPLNLYYFSTILIILLFPVVFKLISIGTLSAITMALIMASFLIAFISSTVFSVLVELFPFGVRYSGVSLAFNLSITIFSSTTPVLLMIFENKFKELYITGFYISFVSIIMLLVSKILIDREIVNKKTLLLPI